MFILATKTKSFSLRFASLIPFNGKRFVFTPDRKISKAFIMCFVLASCSSKILHTHIRKPDLTKKASVAVWTLKFELAGLQARVPFSQHWLFFSYGSEWISDQRPAGFTQLESRAHSLIWKRSALWHLLIKLMNYSHFDQELLIMLLSASNIRW